MKSKLLRFLRTLPTVGAAALIDLNLPFGTLKNSAGQEPGPNEILPALANRIADILTFLAYPLAFIGLVYSIFMLVANSGNPEAFKATKKNIGYIFMGLFVLIFTILIFNFITSIFF